MNRGANSEHGSFRHDRALGNPFLPIVEVRSQSGCVMIDGYLTLLEFHSTYNYTNASFISNRGVLLCLVHIG